MVEYLPFGDDPGEIVAWVGRTAISRDGQKWRAGLQVYCVCDEDHDVKCQYHYPPPFPRQLSGTFGTAKLEGNTFRPNCEYWHIVASNGTHFYAFFSDDVQAFLDTGDVTDRIHPEEQWERFT